MLRQQHQCTWRTVHLHPVTCKMCGRNVDSSRLHTHLLVTRVHVETGAFAPSDVNSQCHYLLDPCYMIAVCSSTSKSDHPSPEQFFDHTEPGALAPTSEVDGDRCLSTKMSKVVLVFLHTMAQHVCIYFVHQCTAGSRCMHLEWSISVKNCYLCQRTWQRSR